MSGPNGYQREHLLPYHVAAPTPDVALEVAERRAAQAEMRLARMPRMLRRKRRRALDTALALLALAVVGGVGALWVVFNGWLAAAAVMLGVVFLLVWRRLNQGRDRDGVEP